MKKTLIYITALLLLSSCNLTKKEYLQENRFDLSSTNFDFPQKDVNLIGFGAYHGSSKTEIVELDLLQSLTQEGTIKYYFPEVDFSTAYFFNQYLESGDTSLLKELVIYNGYHTPQERTIEVYEKWKKFKLLNDALPKKNQVKILGIEWVRNYRYVSKHILEIVNQDSTLPVPIQEIKEMVELDTTSYALGNQSLAYQKLEALVTDYVDHKSIYHSKVNNIKLFEYILKNIEISFNQNPERENIIYENYLALQEIYPLKSTPHFMRIGFFHLEKSREGKDGYPSLFTRLLENKIYPRNKVLSIIGYFADSKVVWDELYDDNGSYTGYTVEAGYGIGDYEKEYFRGIQHLKETKISDRTLFRLNQLNSPYALKEPDLIEVIMTEEDSNGEAVKGMSTLDFIDYAVLISNSKESVPIYEMNKNK